MIGIEHYLTVAATLFVIGIFGLFLNRKNIIILLMSIELMLLAVNINLVAFSSFLGDLAGQVFTLFVLTVAAAEAAIGLAIAALTAALRQGAALAGLMVIPLAIPILIFGAGALARPDPGALLLTGAISLGLCAVTPFVAGAAVRAAREG